MVDPVEVPDNLAKTKLPDKLKQVVRSNPERERNGFSKALQEELEDELKKKRRKLSDIVLIEHQTDEKKQENDKHEAPEDERPDEVEATTTDETTAGSDRSETTAESSGHVDLKA